ncbi:hypothetical protein J437_LFUL010467 [Ladona fulva]|uniref:Uncharacterized protein n=1 Tax=Ladona fulva TaxID=123851 RepID=A0A8K0KL72_LADFU|nr:hypothetical protein J437_LFUL010467 [Ladona fulva]
MSREELELEELLEEEQRQGEVRRREVVREEKEEKMRKVKTKEALIDELMFSDGDAKGILQSFAENEPQRPPSHFSTGIQFGRSGYLPLPKLAEEGEPFIYNPPEAPVGPEDGPPLPSGGISALKERGYLCHVRAVSTGDAAGGYTPLVACYRALQEALAGLYHVSERREVVKFADEESSGNSSPSSKTGGDDDEMSLESGADFEMKSPPVFPVVDIQLCFGKLFEVLGLLIDYSNY